MYIWPPIWSSLIRTKSVAGWFSTCRKESSLSPVRRCRTTESSRLPNLLQKWCLCACHCWPILWKRSWQANSFGSDPNTCPVTSSQLLSYCFVQFHLNLCFQEESSCILMFLLAAWGMKLSEQQRANFCCWNFCYWAFISAMCCWFKD